MPLKMQKQSGINPEYKEASIIDKYPVLESFLAGSFSGTVSTVLFQPLDLIKTRLQSDLTSESRRTKYGILSMVVKIIKDENVYGLWRGLTPSMIRVIPGVGLYFSSLYSLKNIFELRDDELRPVQAVSLGIVARTISGILLIPITVIKTRFESGIYEYKSLGVALRLIYKLEGIRGLSSGLLPTLLRDAPYSGLYFMFYTQLKNTGLSYRYNQTCTNFFYGLLAGICASFITHPVDVVKTKMQLYPSQFKSVHSTFIWVYKKYGVSGYFEGIVPRMLRRTLMTTMAWTVYERITVKINC